jgi:hypothetical protein
VTVREIIGINMSALICIPKYHVTATIFSEETTILGTVWVRTRNSEHLTGGNNMLRNNASYVIVCCLYGQFMQENNTHRNDGIRFYCRTTSINPI